MKNNMKEKMIYKPAHLDYELSPYTGLTRESWIDAGVFLLTGVFRNINSYESPVVLPRSENDVTYPHKNSTGNQRKLEEMAEIFEGLARTFFIAAPLIENNPDIEIEGIRLKDYYKKQILYTCSRNNNNSAGYYEDLQELTGNSEPFRAFQQTVETCALVICLDMCREQIWNEYSKSEKNVVAEFLLSYAHTNTVPQNWRLFNMLDMAFLYKEGYEIDREIMREHGQAILSYYAGDGWYRDGHSFDYYSCWAFNVYAPIWNNWYGYENEPYLAHMFEKNSNKLMETYGDFFDKDGFTNMWGRSNVYRNAATSAFEGNMLLKTSSADPGLSRRIASGSLLQFFTRDDFLYKEGVPAMGFYGEFTPLVQGYSCAESVYWLGKAFLCLHLKKDHPFWSAKENNGTWEKLKDKQVKVTTLDGPGLCFSNHMENGETILRTGKVLKNINDRHGMWNYSKLCYNSKYPWEASAGEEIESQQYVLKDMTTGCTERANVTFYGGVKNEVLYRKQYFDFVLNREMTWIHFMNEADFTVPSGIMRVDKLGLYRRPMEITLGSYGFPDNGTEIIFKENNNFKAIVLKGHDHTGREKQMAMTVFDGFDSIDIIKNHGTNPDSPDSIVIYGKTLRKKQFGYEPYILISQVITKESLENFTDEEIFSIKDIEYSDNEKCGGYGPIKIYMKDGSHKIIDFSETDGKMSL